MSPTFSRLVMKPKTLGHILPRTPIAGLTSAVRYSSTEATANRDGVNELAHTINNMLKQRMEHREMHRFYYGDYGRGHRSGSVFGWLFVGGLTVFTLHWTGKQFDKFAARSPVGVSNESYPRFEGNVQGTDAKFQPNPPQTFKENARQRFWSQRHKDEHSV